MTDPRSAASRQALPVVDTISALGLDPSLLYETVISLASEGMLTAPCINAAAGILLTELGLPAYFFQNISRGALKRVLATIARHMRSEGDRMVLRGELAEVQFDVDGGVQARIATEETRDRMEQLLDEVVQEHRVAYYFGREHRYYTYIVMPQRCPSAQAVAEGASRFAFSRSGGPKTPQETAQRYESFLKEYRESVVPPIEVSHSSATNETRIMFHDDFSRSALPVIRKLFDDLGVTLTRAYWETYTGDEGRIESISSVYIEGKPKDGILTAAVDQLRALLSLHPTGFDRLFVNGELTFDEYLFAVNAGAFVHNFIHKGLETDRQIVGSLDRQDLIDAMALRVFNANRAEYTRKVIREALTAHPDLIKRLFQLFDRKFNPRFKTRPSDATLTRKLKALDDELAIIFIDDTTGHDIFRFMGHFITHVLKTNFYKREKRAFSFRLEADVLDPLVFRGKVFGIFFVAGFYAIGTHMRAEDVARGGLRLLRPTTGNYETELDNMPLLNYALGPVAQRLKHKDIAESGSKGVITPDPEYTGDVLRTVFDYTEGIMDLLQPSNEVVDITGRPEMIFFGPDEGTAHIMDAVASRGRDRGYRYWRALTTGKSIGIPHDTYGLTQDRQVFGLIPHDDKGTELQIDGESEMTTADTARIARRIGRRVHASGMTTVGVMACLRTVLDHLGLKEKDLNLMMTGGPDGDLGANQIQSWKGAISLIIDGGAVLFDPKGLDRTELLKLALARHTSPRLTSAAFPTDKLGGRGFKALRKPGPFALPDGTKVADCALFHRNVLSSPANRTWVEPADIQVFVPCGGFKDTINAGNVRQFLDVFSGLKVIVEGANVFFDDTARDIIATETDILQIKDSSANKGGVTSSSVAEVLTAFLLDSEYEARLVEDLQAKSELIREVFELIEHNAIAETRMLLDLHGQTGAPLYRLSVQTSEWLFALQARLMDQLDDLLAHRDVVEGVLHAYIPPVLVGILGMDRVLDVLSEPELSAYRDAILTKKLAALCLYRHAARWDDFLATLEASPVATLKEVLTPGD